jgi:4-amino-4-deoxy-L-arabinose transferase-like glycosyltransferase
MPRPWLAPAIVLAAMAAAVLLNPLGYRGGGADDWHYLEAARCAAAQGLCPPPVHWWARWTLVAPMGAALALLGESRWVVGLVPLFYAALALTCFTLLVQRQFGRAEAIVAGALLAVTPVVAFFYLQPNIDMPEFAFLLAGALAFQSAARGGRTVWAVVAGVLIGLAILTRPTALAALPMLGLFILMHPPLRRLALPVALGLALPVLAEALTYWLWLGDPLHGWRLALGHAAIASDELPAGFQSARGPLFNPDYIDAWRRAMEIRVHWTIDPVLNLLANPQMGLLLVAAYALALAKRPAGPAVRWLLGASLIWFVCLSYVLAVDPKPRMFLPLAAAAATIAGIQFVRLRGSWRVWLAALLLGAVGLLSLVRIRNEANISALEPVAAAWATADPGFAVEARTSRFLTLVPGIAGRPATGPRLLQIAFERCEAASRGRRVERSYYLEQNGEMAALCLFSRAGPAAPPPR